MRTTSVWIAASALTCVACSPLATPTIGSVIASVVAPLQTTAPSSSSPPTAYTASPFISGPYSEYYSGFEATQTSVQPQPKVSDWTRGRNYQLNLTNPATIPVANVVDPVVLPPSRKYPNVEAEVFAPVGKNFSTVDSIAARTKVYTEISAMIAMNATGSATCGACKAGLVSAQSLAYDYPWEIQSLLLSLCTKFTTSKTCNTTYTPQQSGAIAQILSFANVTGMDGVMLCAKQLPVKNLCPIPAVSPYDASLYFNTTEPLSKVAPTPSGQTTKVLHLSDFHLDPRYTTGSESACTGYLCCRPGGINSSSMSVPAPRYGAYQCDTPWDLAMSAMTAIPVLTGTQDKGFNFTIYTGDLVSHDQDNALGRDYIEYTESVVFGFFSHYLGSGPTYAALGNHDSWPQALNSLNSLASLGDYLKDQFSWNYAHLAALWQHAGWIKEDEANLVRTHYGAYSTITSGGLRIITLNTDFFYTANLFNYINMTDPDPSGTLKFVADELQRAENNGQRAWIIGHVLPGWDGSAGLRNPSDLFSQIQNRYSPHVLAAVFMGHIHDELVYTNYANNGTVKNASTAMTTTWVGPSLTPLTGLNSGFRMYEVDQKTFDIVDSHTFYSNVSEYASLDGQTQFGPSYHYEYSAREAYGANITWPATAPLNATWWHLVTEQMQRQPSLVDQFAKHQGRLSPRTKNCTSDACVAAKICYMKSGTAAQGQTCTPGFSSVQN